jgi:hypothetical protein
MTELTHSDLQRFYQQLYDNGNGLSSATIRKIHHILHSAFDKAILNDIVHRNVAKGSKRFSIYSVCLVSVDTGLRTGELLGLEMFQKI